MSKPFKSLFSFKGKQDQSTGTIRGTCKICKRTYILPEDVQSWPDLCFSCRAAHQAEEMVTRRCPSCQRMFTFSSMLSPWPRFCEDCRGKKKKAP